MNVYLIIGIVAAVLVVSITVYFVFLKKDTKPQVQVETTQPTIPEPVVTEKVRETEPPLNLGFDDNLLSLYTIPRVEGFTNTNGAIIAPSSKAIELWNLLLSELPEFLLSKINCNGIETNKEWMLTNVDCLLGQFMYHYRNSIDSIETNSRVWTLLFFLHYMLEHDLDSPAEIITYNVLRDEITIVLSQVKEDFNIQPNAIKLSDFRYYITTYLTNKIKPAESTCGCVDPSRPRPQTTQIPVTSSTITSPTVTPTTETTQIPVTSNTVTPTTEATQSPMSTSTTIETPQPVYLPMTTETPVSSIITP